MSGDEFCDKVLYVETGLANKEQIEDAFVKSIDHLGIPCRFRVNFLFGRDCKPLGSAYVWISSNKVVNALVGKNLDGTDRESNVIPDSDSKLTITETSSKTQILLKSSDSSDCADKEHNTWPDDVLKLSKQNEKIGPLIETPKYTYNKDQLKYIREDEGPDAKIPEYGALLCKKAYLPMVNSQQDYNTIVSRGLPEWVGRKEILTIFKSYSGKHSEYPKINIHQTQKSKMAFVSFDPDTDTTMMVLLMVKRIWIRDSSEPDREAMVTFQFARDNNDRD